MRAGKLKLEVAVPERQVFCGEVASVEVPAKDGYLGVLPGHAPLLAELGHGVLSFEAGGENGCMALNGGLMEVLPERVRVLADTAEWAREVDVERAEQARRRANDRLQNHGMDSDVERALRAVRRAEARLAAARFGESRFAGAK